MASLEDLSKHLARLSEELNDAFEQIGGPSLESQRATLDDAIARPDFWSDTQKAADITKQQAKLNARLQPWIELRATLAELSELASIADESMRADLAAQTEECETRFTALKDQLKLSGPYDDHDAFLNIHAGAGGTDAQDWAEMIERMYLRWCERENLKATIIDRSAGEEAGLKSVSIGIEGPFAYGRLRGEHGVHRLVRLSPFNADALRQTSFAKVEVTPQIDSPDDVRLDEKDLKIDVYRSGGKGGQSVNTTDSAVRVTHLPTGIVVAIQNERSQLQNKEMALAILRSKLAQLQLEQHVETLKELKGPNEQAAWGNQIRNYVLHPYKLVKDVRTEYETSDPDAVLDGELNPFINSYLEHTLGRSV